MRNSKRGQSVIEFILVIAVFLNLLVITINATMAFAVQQYMSYAAFMAARAYQASNLSPDGQAQAALTVLKSYVFIVDGDEGSKIFRFGKKEIATARNVGWELPDSSASGLPKYGQMPPDTGRRILITFEVPLFKLPFGQKSKALAWIPLQAVSYLGREPTVEECHSFFKNFYDYYKHGGSGDEWLGMDDNNC
ncbi:MAG: TadE family protein [Bdellovibrionota bacterium]